MWGNQKFSSGKRNDDQEAPDSMDRLHNHFENGRNNGNRVWEENDLGLVSGQYPGKIR